MSRLSGLLITAVLMTGCRAFALPTDPSSQLSDNTVCAGVGLNGILRGSSSSPMVAWLEDRNTGARRELVWPSGYQARFAPQLEVRDAGDVVVGRDGYLIIGTCRPLGDFGPIYVSARELRPPGWQPGDG